MRWFVWAGEEKRQRVEVYFRSQGRFTDVKIHVE